MLSPSEYTAVLRQRIGMFIIQQNFHEDNTNCIWQRLNLQISNIFLLSDKRLHASLSISLPSFKTNIHTSPRGTQYQESQ
jgi:hypothetical protein